jgi:hypothetical protein
MDNLLPQAIENKIYLIRNMEVMLDSDLAEIYGVETRIINQAVQRNPEKFPDDLMFEISLVEFENLRSQNVTSSWGGRRYSPKVFTEQGVYMLATVLKSQKAIGVTLAIMRTFTKIRRYAISHNELVSQIQELRQELVQSKVWTKDRLSAVADTIIILEESLGELQDVVLDIKSAEAVETIGFLRDKNKV